MDKYNQTNISDPLTFADIIKIFHGKMKLLLCVILIGAILGGAAGAVISYFKTAWGGEITFYLSPSGNSETLLQFLKSESFAEELLLDEYGLPEDWDKTDPDYIEAKKAVEAEWAARERKIEIYKTISAFTYSSNPTSENEYERISFNEIESRYNSLVSEYDRIYALLEIYKSTYSDKVAEHPSHEEKTLEYESALAAAEAERNEYKENFYLPKINERIRLNDEYNEVHQALKDARDASEEAVEKVLVKWRDDKDVEKLISTIQKSVVYEYAQIENDKNVDSSIDQNYSFLEITVAVEGDSDIADTIIESIKERTPHFIENSIETLTGTAEAECMLISTFTRSHDVSEISLVVNSVIYAAVSAVLFAVAACICVFVKAISQSAISDKEENPKKT